jgi:hypothetical protein
VDAALSVLGKLNGSSSYTNPRRTLSAAARKKISIAQKARWAKRDATGQAALSRPKRTISAAGREKDLGGSAGEVGESQSRAEIENAFTNREPVNPSHILSAPRPEAMNNSVRGSASNRKRSSVVFSVWLQLQLH